MYHKCLPHTNSLIVIELGRLPIQLIAAFATENKLMQFIPQIFHVVVSLFNHTAKQFCNWFDQGNRNNSIPEDQLSGYFINLKHGQVIVQ